MGSATASQLVSIKPSARLLSQLAYQGMGQSKLLFLPRQAATGKYNGTDSACDEWSLSYYTLFNILMMMTTV